MRLFLAVYPSEQAVSAWNLFRKSAPSWPLRWTDPESLHLTLNFFGETEPSKENQMNVVLEKVSKSIGAFSLSLRNGGTFGSPSVFWAGVDGDVRILSELAHIAELEMKTIGFQFEQSAYHPHMTVARLRNKNDRLGSGFSQEFSEWIRPFASEAFSVAELSLVESRPGPMGSTYIVRRSFGLS